MAIEREEVEMLARVAATQGATCRVTPDLLTELCRSYLAVLDAPIGKVECVLSTLLYVGDGETEYSESLDGQRVRLVPADGGG